MLHLHVIIFLVLSPLTHNPTSLWLILLEERQDHSNCRENSSPFCLCCCVIGGGGGWGLGLVNLLFFYPPSHPYYFMGHPTPKPTTFPGSSPDSSPKETLGTSLPQASRGSAIHMFLVYVGMHVSPAEEGHGIGFAITTTVVLHR